MPNSRRKSSRKVKEGEINKLVVNAVSTGNLVSLKKLVHAHGLSYCEEWRGGYMLLCEAIKLGHIDIAKFLLEKGAKADGKTSCCADTPLHFAVKQRCVELVRQLLKKNAPVNATNCQNETPLHLAAKDGYVEIVEELLKHKASVMLQTKEGSTPLLLAAEGRYEEVVSMLLRHACVSLRTSGRSGNVSLLERILLSNPTICIKVNRLVGSIVTHDSGQSRIVDEFMSHGFVLGRKHVTKPLLLAAVRKNYVKLIEDILKNGAYRKDEKHNALLLDTAVRKGHKEIVTLLLEAGFDTNATNEAGKTPICCALTCKEEDKCVEIIQMLMASGANVQEAPELLHAAVTEGFIEVCKLLIENGVEVNTLNCLGETPLYLSCDWAHGKESRLKKDNIAKLLLTNGADVNMKSANGRTAFHRAALNGRKNAVCLFLENGVNVDQRAEDDWTPLHLASEYGGEEIVEILLKHRANVDARQRDGWTPLHRAACSKFPSSTVIEKLLKFGADIDARGLENKTALHCVFSAGFYRWRNEVVKSFVDNGCDINVETSDGKTAIDLAIARSEASRHDSSSLEPSLKTLAKYAIKLKAAGLFVSEKNSYLLSHLVAILHLEDSVFVELSNFWQECEEEVNRMKNEELSREFTLYDLLVISKNPACARNKAVMHTLKHFNFKRFPLYKSVILGNLRRSESRLELLNAGQRTLDLLMKTSCKLNGNKYSVVPIELLEQIVLYLSTSELNSLLSCGETLKRQLKLQVRQ